MVNQRWYDKDPTLSMAVSLLQNIPKTDQLKAAKYIFTLVEKEKLFEKYDIADPFRVSYIFPFHKREKLEPSAWRLIEIMKHLPYELQLELGLCLINYIYLLDSGFDIREEDDYALQSEAL